MGPRPFAHRGSVLKVGVPCFLACPIIDLFTLIWLFLVISPLVTSLRCGDQLSLVLNLTCRVWMQSSLQVLYWMIVHPCMHGAIFLFQFKDFHVIMLIMFNTVVYFRMENIPSANMRQHKLDQQRKLIEEKQRQKRQMQVRHGRSLQ